MDSPKQNAFDFDTLHLQRLAKLSASADGSPPAVARSIPCFRLNEEGETASTPARPHPFLEPDAIDLTQTASHRIKCQSGDIWIEGNVLLCACPDCSAPVAIRTWLRLANCWRCETSIALTEEQNRAIDQLTEHPPTPPRNALPAPPPPLFKELDRTIGPPVVDDPPSPDHQELENLTRDSFLKRSVRRIFRLTPAWLVSLLLHLIVILILALIMLGDESEPPETITLSSFVGAQDELGGDIRIEKESDALQDDLLVRTKLEKGDQELRHVLRRAQQDARELVVDPTPIASLPSLQQVKKNITTRPGKLISFAARDPRVRAEIVRKEGGTTLTEAAVARGLRWLASVQNQDGSWSLANYRRHTNPRNRGDTMGTSLALLPLLGAGQTHEYGIYKKNVAAGLAWLVEHQKEDGDLRAGDKGQAGMYAHGQATIVLCEALALTGDQQLREPAQKAIAFIEKAQHKQGGWRYHPGDAGDTSVFGWQMMALQSAQAPGLDLKIDEATFQLADYYLDQVAAPATFRGKKTRLPEGAAYAYQPHRKATPAMTAEAILCRMYLGWKKDDPRLQAAVRWLATDHLPHEDKANLYYWYYGTQVMHHYGGKTWKRWNQQMRKLLIGSQETRGSYPGSWNPGDFEWGERGGRIYTTSLAVCTLEIYYRHLPLFQKIELDSW